MHAAHAYCVGVLCEQGPMLSRSRLTIKLIKYNKIKAIKREFRTITNINYCSGTSLNTASEFT